MLRRGTNRVCGIRRYFLHLLEEETEIDWKKFFKKQYRRVEQQAVWCRAFAQTDITAWVNAMDVFNDFLLESLFKRKPALGSYILGSIGGILTCSALKTTFPAVACLAKEIHDKRGESALSHPVKKRGEVVIKATGRIKFHYLSRAKKLIRAALRELASKW